MIEIVGLAPFLGESHYGLPWFCLFDSQRPGKQFYSHVGTGPPLPWYYQ